MPDPKHPGLARLTYVVMLAGATLWCVLILLAPALATVTGVSSAASNGLYAFFQPVCHQNPGRSFSCFGHPLAVCMRCSAIYFSFLLGVVVFPFFRSLSQPAYPSRIWLAVAVLPMVLEVGGEWLGLYHSTMLTRSITGGFAGLAFAFFIIPAAIEAARQLTQTNSRSTSHTIHKGATNA